MYKLPAEYYDIVYSSKDYEREAHQVRNLIGDRCPGAQSLLDVACGTGAHDLHLSRYFEVDGIDFNPEFLERARERNPRGRYQHADMRNFRQDRLYDGIVCLFSSIGYLQTLDEVERCLDCFREHLAPGGIVLIEPWFTPESWKPGAVHVLNAERSGVKICRMGFSDALERISINPCHYLIGTVNGVEHVEEVHEMGLFTVEEMKTAFRRTGLEVEYDEEGLIGRGMYIAKRSA